MQCCTWLYIAVGRSLESRGGGGLAVKSGDGSGSGGWLKNVSGSWSGGWLLRVYLGHGDGSGGVAEECIWVRVRGVVRVYLGQGQGVGC